ncbi:MAG TPA: glycine oxidase ThiO [Gammaproteobacteria bacterium]|nr:glycine oxidase ThiO [Gammaproteobacteria bacterium]
MSDVTVIGGGLIGMLTARELALAGATVTLLERRTAGREASWAGGGILSPLYPWRYPAAVSRLARWSQACYPTLAGELLAHTGIDPEYQACGLLLLDQDENAQALGWAGQWGYELSHAGEAELRELEPRLNPAFSRSQWWPTLGQIRNPRLLQALASRLAQLKVKVVEHCEVRGLRTQAGRLAGLDTTQGPRSTALAVVAGGAWAAEILRPAGACLPVRPVRGQMLLFSGPPDLLRHIVLYNGRYLVPRRDGRVLAGSTVEEVGFDKSTTPTALADLRRAACELIPALESLPIEHHWAGLRPGSPQGVPFIGPCPGVQGLYVNAGHFRNGVVTGPASARLLADMILKRPPILDPAAYRPPAAHATAKGAKHAKGEWCEPDT